MGGLDFTAGGSIAFEQAETASAKPAVFTNCGDADFQKAPVKSAKKKLTRVPFTVSRLMEFCNKRELVNQTGHDVFEWPLVVLKEATDNALDECEEAGIAPEIDIEVNGDKIVTADNGRGIPAQTIQCVLDYSIRISSREPYVSPTRGAQGNALKTILPMGYVLDDRRGEDACGETVIEAHGLAHHIKFSVDHLRQEPRIEHTTKPSSIVRGTRITVDLPELQSGQYQYVIERRRQRFLELVESYAWLNPHLGVRVSWNGETKIDVKASNPNWYKWLPSWPTSAHWYDKGLKASGNGQYPANARQLMYAARPHIQKVTGKQLDDNYFTQTLLPDYLQENDVDWDVAYDARGHFSEPHGGSSFGIGTLDVRSYLAGFHLPSFVDAGVSQGKVETSGPSGNFGAVAFIEKEGFDQS
jgi:hypothetical protein